MSKQIYQSDRIDPVEAMADTLNDAIKVGLVRSSKLGESMDQSTDAAQTIKSEVHGTEIEWYMKKLYSPLEIRNIDKAAVVKLTLEKLLQPRIVNIAKQQPYSITAKTIENGVVLLAHLASKKPVKQSEPNLEYHAR